MGKKSEAKQEKKKKEKKRNKLEPTGKKGGKTKKRKSASMGEASAEERLEMIATAAYYIAESHGFTPGRSEADWQAAELQVDAMLKDKT